MSYPGNASLAQDIQDRILETESGELLPISVIGLGSREIDTADGPTFAQGFAVEDEEEFHRELWYDENGLLVAAGLTATDGTSINLVRQSPVTARAAEQARLLDTNQVSD